MRVQKLTMLNVAVRPVSVPLKRPVVSKVGVYEEWPLILIDLQTQEGPVGRSYLEPYLKRAARYIAPATAVDFHAGSAFSCCAVSRSSSAT